jgi:cobyrinic acid a,c-diamide synthase
MSCLPRFAVGPVQRGIDSRPVLWALLDVLDRLGLRVQTFFSRACLEAVEAATAITGTTPRHLDSWLMTAEQCRDRFRRASRKFDLSIVQGCFADELDDSSVELEQPGGSRLATLSEWLALPRLGVIDLPTLSGAELPTHKPQVDALVMDRVSCRCDFFRWQTILETLWGIPVIAGLENSPALRCALNSLRSRREPPRELCRKLGDQLLRYLAPERLLSLACRQSWPADDGRASGPKRCDRRARRSDRDGAWMSPEDLTVAVAYDDAFGGYFPDVLDALEQRGVAIEDFSPLKDESLPAAADVVYIGCGRPDLYARELSDNQCLMLALRDHLCAGKRIYAEGGGLAYLCQNLTLRTGDHVPMAGVLPAAARYVPAGHPPKPIELTLADDFWLGDRGQRVRGYLNESWQLEPVGRLASCAAEPERRLDLVERHQAVGSRVHLNFALQPALLEGFLRPSAPALAWELPSHKPEALAR